MKKQITNMAKASLLLLFTLNFQLSTVVAQAPNAIKYQAVARDSDDKVIANQEVSLTISILQGSLGGTEVFTETHDSTTNAYGLVTLNIGAGNPTDFANIDWSDGPYFVKVEMDGNEMGTSQLLSVPYAKYADNAGNVLALDNTTPFTPDADYEPATKKYVDDNAGGSIHYVGEEFGGGVVFYVDETGEHGLIVSLDDISTSAPWGQYGTTTGATSTWDGDANSQIIDDGAAADDAVLLAQNHNGGSNSDWYLPSIDELNLLYNSRFRVNKALSNITGASQIGQNYYWSSTESNSDYAWYYRYTNGNTNDGGKNNSYYVRAVRAF